jgi:hypothetical protein
MDSKDWFEQKPNWAPDLVGDELMTLTPIEGYRFWYLPVNSPGIMRSYWMTNGIWLPGQRVEAQCMNHLSCEAGNEGCKAGIYAFKYLRSAAECYFLAMDQSIAHNPPDMGADMWFVLGKVKLWGTVVEHSLGWRAKYAYPSLFYETSPRIKSLAELYRVPLEPRPKSITYSGYHPNINRGLHDADHSY